SALAAGAHGEAPAIQGAVEVRNVPSAQRPPTALSSPAQLVGKSIAPGGVATGRPVLAEEVVTPQTAVGTVSIPRGKTALAIQLANVPGVAGFAGRGDKIDIYGSGKVKAAAGQPDQNATLLLLQAVDVLSVDGTALAPSPGQPGGQGLVFLVAVTPAQAEKLVYFSTFQQLYFSLLPKDSLGAVPTPGVADATAFRPGP
ncbi:MAG: Flp pilus assembly protein CpaB, partial [Acidimicrobiales bacterium]